MKKLIALLAAMLMVFAFAACSDDDTGGTTGTTGSTGGTGTPGPASTTNVIGFEPTEWSSPTALQNWTYTGAVLTMSADTVEKTQGAQSLKLTSLGFITGTQSFTGPQQQIPIGTKTITLMVDYLIPEAVFQARVWTWNATNIVMTNNNTDYANVSGGWQTWTWQCYNGVATTTNAVFNPQIRVYRITGINNTNKTISFDNYRVIFTP